MSFITKRYARLKLALRDFAEPCKDTKKVLECLSPNDTPIPSELLKSFGEKSYSNEKSQKILAGIQSRLTEKKENWRVILKALQLLHKLMLHGSDRFALKRSLQLKPQVLALKSFKHQEKTKDGREKGAIVRDLASTIYSLMSENVLLVQAREKAIQIKPSPRLTPETVKCLTPAGAALGSPRKLSFRLASPKRTPSFTSGHSSFDSNDYRTDNTSPPLSGRSSYDYAGPRRSSIDALRSDFRKEFEALHLDPTRAKAEDFSAIRRGLAPLKVPSWTPCGPVSPSLLDTTDRIARAARARSLPNFRRKQIKSRPAPKSARKPRKLWPGPVSPAIGQHTQNSRSASLGGVQQLWSCSLGGSPIAKKKQLDMPHSPIMSKKRKMQYRGMADFTV